MQYIYKYTYIRAKFLEDASSRVQDVTGKSHDQPVALTPSRAS